MKFTHTVLALGLLAGVGSSAFAQTTSGAPGDKSAGT